MMKTVLSLSLLLVAFGCAAVRCAIADEFSATNAQLTAGPSQQSLPSGVTDVAEPYDSSLPAATSKRDPLGEEDGITDDVVSYCDGTSQKCVITGCKPMTWYRGCAPTAAAVMMSCHRKNFPQLFGDIDPNDEPAIASAMLDMISTDNNHNDYGLPMDSHGAIQNDKSALATLPHPNECLADLMHTSQSAHGNAFGETMLFDVPDAIANYLTLVGAPYEATITMTPFADLTWEMLVDQINTGLPVLLIVDSNFDGVPDHAMVCVGYDHATHKYAALNLFDHGKHWYPFGGASRSCHMGIFSAIFLRFHHHIPPMASCRSITQPQWCRFNWPRCQWCPMRLAPSYGQCVPRGLCTVMRNTCDMLRWPCFPPQFVCLSGSSPTEYLWCSRTWFEGLMPCAPGTICRVPGPHRFNPCW